ncbi:MAG: hypothetical protein Kow0029_23490 [Candidatus Rifleibacteriota bacterium]
MKEFRDFYGNLDLSDIRLLLTGLILLLIPLAYFFFVGKIETDPGQTRQYSVNTTSRQSAFNLTPTRSVSGMKSQTRKKSAFTVSPRTEQIDEELDRAWARIQKIPKIHHYPADMPADTKMLIAAEDDETIITARSLLDAGDYNAAEELFKTAIKDAGSNDFKALYAYGGLMEIYQLRGEVIKFREAFSKYARYAQNLKHVYGPLADNIARAQQMFEQLAQVDPVKIREHITRYNLANGTHYTYEEVMKALNDAQAWFPRDLEEPEPKMPDYLHRK